MPSEPSNMLRIGVFYDGQYFFNVSNYYCYQHPKRSRISIHGLHEFVRRQISEKCSRDIRLCQIVDAHYFRGRLNAKTAESQNKLLQERVFDDILMSENITTHYMPLLPDYDGGYHEKGIDVWLALEAYELAIYKRFDVLVLIAGDSDYIPLVRKLNTLGTQVMLLSWDFEYVDINNKTRRTRTSQQLLEEVTHPLSMNIIIDDRVSQKESIIKGLFLTTPSPAENHDKTAGKSNTKQSPSKSENTPTKEVLAESFICKLCGGFGFIKSDNGNLFFYHTSLENCDFNSLTKGMKVKYSIGTNNDNKEIAEKVWVLQDL